MKEQWKEKFTKLFNSHNEDERWAERYFDFITNILEEQKKELLEQILSEAPEDKNTMDTVFIDFCEGFNACNAQWRELLTKHI